MKSSLSVCGGNGGVCLQGRLIRKLFSGRVNEDEICLRETRSVVDKDKEKG